ncbi:MAG: hypothetical protein HOE30_13995 [Deltaproteobacteria bacterium]|jgi:hypothetical protein|nr:hypothetical protein [Deltaproteobacteria bacterium]MBT4642872.1 hypothetical protein [Deltaproteobacteria bacterium]MBT7154188.1 hypothetical protein [Deltaproteobacteria bacterium]MBT7712227.1 hypothetical protein [Deltaproteobacteria bacterium]
MNTSKLNSSSLGRIQDATKNALNRKDNPLGKKQKPENSAARTKQTNKAEVLSSLKDPKKTESLDNKFENASPQINDYMKMISRFENKVKQDEIEKEDLERVMQALEDKILSMNEQQKTKLKNIDFFKKRGIENLKSMRETLIEMFDDEKERENVFEFLKSPEFVTLLMNEQKPLENYKPTSAGANNLNSKVPSEANGVTETRTPPKV